MINYFVSFSILAIRQGKSSFMTGMHSVKRNTSIKSMESIGLIVAEIEEYYKTKLPSAEEIYVNIISWQRFED